MKLSEAARLVASVPLSAVAAIDLDKFRSRRRPIEGSDVRIRRAPARTTRSTTRMVAPRSSCPCPRDVAQNARRPSDEGAIPEVQVGGDRVRHHFGGRYRSHTASAWRAGDDEALRAAGPVRNTLHFPTPGEGPDAELRRTHPIWLSVRAGHALTGRVGQIDEVGIPIRHRSKFGGLGTYRCQVEPSWTQIESRCSRGPGGRRP